MLCKNQEFGRRGCGSLPSQPRSTKIEVMVFAG
jgi:hypothetical protein